ncbi:hypothetical protein CKO_02538 [Citrobacter koseri ATCC BAA-895]|uniref:Uncharacterized protein n=1 Tax=Citrobacter koseri (strain ATCC BAA-895 / CDC 4225-83 / SGSC4696) TaxID=290338 RepID=A8AJI4_CITK8|nr:hypothetical protein CKO_02538 [Citrobacter koseri ATCC BAA-895]
MNSGLTNRPVALCLPGLRVRFVGRIRRYAAIRPIARWRYAYRAYGEFCRPDKALPPPSGESPGGAMLTGPTGKICRPDKALRRHPANCLQINSLNHLPQQKKCLAPSLQLQ